MRLTYEPTGDNIAESHGSPTYPQLWGLTGRNLETGRDMAYLVKDVVVDNVCWVLQQELDNQLEKNDGQ